MNISKELLSLIMGCKVKHITYAQDNELGYAIKGNPFCRLNLDTLGRLCKEWCNTKGYSLSSGKFEEYFCGAAKTNGSDCEFCDEPLYLKFHHSKSELEAIIKATEFVAKEKVRKEINND